MSLGESQIKPDRIGARPTERIWLLKARDLDEENLFLSEGFYGFGATEDAIDTSKFENEKSHKDALKKRWSSLGLPSQRADSYYWWFYQEAEVGDDVYLCRTSKESNLLVARGKITGEYKFSESIRPNDKIAGSTRIEYAHSRSIEWTSRPVENEDIQKETGYVHSDLVRRMHQFKFDQNRLQKILDNFMPKHPLNLISYGPPGTGKTYHAITRAVAICRDQAEELLRMRKGIRKDIEEEYSKLNSEGRIEMITFHQSYDYTDFISGIRPSLDTKGQLGYELTKGPLYRISTRASEELLRSSKEGRIPSNYVIIIDEINRGNVAKIFGELITLIDEDKRWDLNSSSGIGIPLLYDEKNAKPFKLPSNLYIIGTMNSADRSVQKLDSALRRRFYFDAVDPDATLLKTDGSFLSDFLETLNKKLEKERPNSGCQVGHAWFMRKGLPITLNNDLVEILNEKVFPLLQYDWFWDDENTLRNFFKNDSGSYLSKTGRIIFEKSHVDEINEFFKKFSSLSEIKE